MFLRIQPLSHFSKFYKHLTLENVSRAIITQLDGWFHKFIYELILAEEVTRPDDKQDGNEVTEEAPNWERSGILERGKSWGILRKEIAPGGNLLLCRLI